MKKIVFAGLLVVSTLTAMSAEGKISLTNTFGGDSGQIAGNNFLRFDKDGNKKDISVSERAQIDLVSEKIDSRVRLDFKNLASGLTETSDILLNGYINFRPIEQLNFIGGNQFFWKWATPGAYLAATDDYYAHGKLADTNGAGTIFNLNSDNFGLILAGAVGKESRLDLNFGAQFALKDNFTLGLTAQDVTEKSYTIGSYVAVNAVKNLLLNFGYTYNPNSVPLKHTTQHLAQVSAGWTFEDPNFSVFTDFAAGLNNKTAYNPESDSFDELDSGIPFYTAVRAKFSATENIDVNGWVQINHWLSTDDNYTDTTVYSYFDYKTKAGTIRSGVKVYFTEKDGYQGFDIPLSWKYNLSKDL